MSSILLITSSPRAEASHSTRIATELAKSLAAAKPGSEINPRDLAAHPLPHIDAVFTSGITTPKEQRTPEQARAVAVSDGVVDEVLAADSIVIAAGFINFSIPSTLKSWLDHLTRAGRTFRYNAHGPEGLVTGRKVYLVVAYGGVYSEGSATQFDHAVPYLKTILSFMGMTDVEVIRVEGLAMGADVEQVALSRARELVSDHALAA